MPSADALAHLDIEGSERFVVAEGLTPAAALTWQQVVSCLQDDRTFMVLVAQGRPLPAQEIPALRAGWVAQSGLVDGHDLERLLWTMQRFSREIEVDLLQHVGVDLGGLWRDRRWRLLLNLIDHLPRATWTQQALSNNEEYAKLVAEAILKAKDDPDEDAWSPPLVESTPEVVVLSTLVDAVNQLRAVLIMANSKAGSAPPKIEPYPRPRTQVDRMVADARRKKRWAKHDTLANRLLPNRNKEAQA